MFPLVALLIQLSWGLSLEFEVGSHRICPEGVVGSIHDGDAIHFGGFYVIPIAV
ncbi:hypothetical protein AMATHDRAFT_11469 [Amanita thiersii Skay4041]|uniref:Uncharacterized protein n=1 Tax=Amanita thiersii Skay4041 TaxID=703135 RepID=A0A2A9NA37_9AGAR|nr:hypothetical protein AMATHDRAFT_11469 [Amanita thiersii Skay4041]